MTRLRFLVTQSERRRGPGAGSDELLSVSIHRGVVRRSAETDDQPRAEDLESYKVVQVGDVVLNRMRAFQGAVGRAGNAGVVSPDYTVLRVGPKVDGRFLHHLFRSRWFVGEMVARLRGIGSTDTGSVRTPRINWEDLGNIDAPVPPLAEQRAIADYLDAETARIDALIAKKQQLIHLLEERWGRYVRHELRAAGEIVPLKRGWQVTDCKHRTPTYQPSGFPVVSPGDTTPGRLDLSRCHRFVDQDDFTDLADGARRPRRGDIVYSRNASIGIASFVDTDEPFSMGQDVCLITSRLNDCLFLTYALNSLGVEQLEELKLGSTFSRVNISQITELKVPLPSPTTQRRVAAHLDQRRTSVDRLLNAITNQIALLAEHRQALITAAVTGEFTVNRAA